MDNLQQKAAILGLIDNLRKAGSWCGETHVQKSALFVETLANGTLDFEFILYKHGPYSFDLSDEITAMRAYGFLDWDIPSPRYGPRLKLTEFGCELLRNNRKSIERLRLVSDFVASKFASYGVATLERLATALYFSVHDRIEGEDDRARKIHQIKPHVSEKQALDAIKEVDTLLSEWKAINRKPFSRSVEPNG